MQNHASVHLIDPTKGDPTRHTEMEVCGYTFGGKAIAVDSPLCLAKSVLNKITGTTRYYLKRATVGPENGRLYNEHSPCFMPSPNRERSLGPFGKSQYQFRQASQKAFEHYLAYLRTNNPSHILMAERET